MLTPWKKSYDKLRLHLRKQRHYFANKSPSSQSYGFPVVMYKCELDHKESWVPKNWCFWTMVPEKILESPLDCKEIQPVHSKGNQFWVLIGRTDAEAEVPILWPPDGNNWFLRKDPDAWKGWRREKRMRRLVDITDLMDMSLSRHWEMAKGGETWHAAVHGVGKESDTTELLNNNKKY